MRLRKFTQSIKLPHDRLPTVKTACETAGEGSNITWFTFTGYVTDENHVTAFVLIETFGKRPERMLRSQFAEHLINAENNFIVADKKTAPAPVAKKVTGSGSFSLLDGHIIKTKPDGSTSCVTRNFKRIGADHV